MVLTCMVPDLEVSRNGYWNWVGWGLKAPYSGHQAQLPVREGRGRTWVYSHFLPHNPVCRPQTASNTYKTP